MRTHIRNIGLAAFLVVMCAYTGWDLRSEGDSIDWIDWLAYAAVTVILVVNSVRREPPCAADDRFLVWLATAVSTVYFVGFEMGAGTFSTIVYAAVIGFHILGDVTLVYLGRSFSILPAYRQVRTGWLYRYIRHPTYATYMITDVLFVASSPSVRNMGILVLGCNLFIARSLWEERILSTSEDYRAYCKRTPFRFLPGII